MFWQLMTFFDCTSVYLWLLVSQRYNDVQSKKVTTMRLVALTSYDYLWLNICILVTIGQWCFVNKQLTANISVMLVWKLVIKMSSLRGKRQRPSRNELPKRYRCRDRYNKALKEEMNKFVTKNMGEKQPNDIQESEPRSSNTR